MSSFYSLNREFVAMLAVLICTGYLITLRRFIPEGLMLETILLAAAVAVAIYIGTKKEKRYW